MEDKLIKRNQLKKAHESSVLQSFIDYQMPLNTIVKIIETPDPPDAIATINGNTTWIEITDAFFNKELAESITSYAASDKPHKPVPKEKKFCIDPDMQFSEVLTKVIVEKYDKNSLRMVYKYYGAGILLVGIINPFADVKDLIKSKKSNILQAIKLKEQRFKEIYFYDVHDHAFSKLI